MNIFILDKSPNLAAQYHCDKHVVKMILEAAQLLSTAHRVMDGHIFHAVSPKGRKLKRWKLLDERQHLIYQATHVNHPCAKWVREGVLNYNWLHDHLMCLLDEYEYRYEKQHKVKGTLSLLLSSPPHALQNWEWTEPALAMPENFVVDNDPVESYRNYYREAKSHLHSWKKRGPPGWL